MILIIIVIIIIIATTTTAIIIITFFFLQGISSSLHSTHITTLHTSARKEITRSPRTTTPMSTAGKRGVISSPTSVKVVASMVATSSVHKIIPTSDTITSPPPTSKEAETVEPETEEPVTEERKTEEPETEEPGTGTFIVTVNIPTNTESKTVLI